MYVLIYISILKMDQLLELKNQINNITQYYQSHTIDHNVKEFILFIFKIIVLQIIYQPSTQQIIIAIPIKFNESIDVLCDQIVSDIGRSNYLDQNYELIIKITKILCEYPKINSIQIDWNNNEQILNNISISIKDHGIK